MGDPGYKVYIYETIGGRKDHYMAEVSVIKERNTGNSAIE